MENTKNEQSNNQHINFAEGKIISENQFAKHIYQENSQTLFTYWFETTERMSPEEFKVEMENWGNISVIHKPKKIYDLCRNFIYPIAPEEQVWLAHLLNPIWIKAGVEKYAHIVPEEFIANMSTMQLFEEFEDMKVANQFVIYHFSDEEEALNWLNK